MRTSLSHPLKIAKLPTPERGRIGLTLCPGKKDPKGMTGPWDRDLAVDLDVIREWGAAAVVTLVEAKELDLLEVPHLGKEVVRRHMSWFTFRSSTCRRRTYVSSMPGAWLERDCARSCDKASTCSSPPSARAWSAHRAGWSARTCGRIGRSAGGERA